MSLFGNYRAGNISHDRDDTGARVEKRRFILMQRY